MNIKTALLVSTFNWPEALNLVFESILNQHVFPDEVLVADDGSGDDTKQLVNEFSKKCPVPVLYFWQEDDGFRKAIILNKAIAGSKAEYIIQVDGDCILHPSFIKDHKAFAEKGVYLYGSRVNIKKQYLSTLFDEKKVSFFFFSKGINKRTRALYIPFFSLFYKKRNLFSKKYRGCNTSFFKSDFFAINGYDEEFKGWGREDSELALRFHNYGLQARRLRYVGIVYHIFHEEKSRSNLKKNDGIEQKTIIEKRVWCANGVDKYL